MTLPSPSSDEDLDGPEQLARAKAELRRQHGALFDTISALLHRHDPIHIGFAKRTEYDNEACTILRHLPQCRSEEDALAMVHREFCSWFNGRIAGPTENYAGIARELWSLWMERKEKTPTPPPRADG